MNKFNIKQKVYFVTQDGISSDTVIQIYLTKEDELIYVLKGRTYTTFYEYMLYNTPEGVLEFLKNSINKEEKDV
jgi:hypothetical protein